MKKILLLSALVLAIASAHAVPEVPSGGGGGTNEVSQYSTNTICLGADFVAHYSDEFGSFDHTMEVRYSFAPNSDQYFASWVSSDKEVNWNRNTGEWEWTPIEFPFISPKAYTVIVTNLMDITTPEKWVSWYGYAYRPGLTSEAGTRSMTMDYLYETVVITNY